jgi:hypothetical protein
MTKEHEARELPDVQDRVLAEFARNIRRAIESPLKPMVHGVVPLDDEHATRKPNTRLSVAVPSGGWALVVKTPLKGGRRGPSIIRPKHG